MTILNLRNRRNLWMTHLHLFACSFRGELPGPVGLSILYQHQVFRLRSCRHHQGTTFHVVDWFEAQAEILYRCEEFIYAAFMRIEASEIIVGQPALTIRRLMRKGQGSLWGIGFVEENLHVNSGTAKRIIRRLESEGYIERKDSRGQRDCWENTIKGNALGLASAAKSVKRARAEQKLQEFLKRVKHVNDDDYFLYKVEKVILFGSFLTSKESVNDVDLAIKLLPKIGNHEEFQKLSRQRIREAYEKGRTFSNFLDELSWPQMEVKRYLKSRSRILSLHDTDDGVLDQCESQVIYEDPPDADA